MNKATAKIYEDLISECLCMQIVFEGDQEYELAERYREKEVELRDEFEYLKTPEGWQRYLEHQREVK